MIFMRMGSQLIKIADNFIVSYSGTKYMSTVQGFIFCLFCTCISFCCNTQLARMLKILNENQIIFNCKNCF